MVGVVRKVRRRATRAAGALNRPVRADTRALREDVRKWSASTDRGLRVGTAELLQEIQASREKVRRDLDSVVAKLEQVRSGNARVERELASLAMRLDNVERTALVSARRVAVNCGDGEILVGTSFGLILVAAQDQAVLAGLLEGGDLERGTRLLIERVLSKGAECFVDVGANIGCHSVAAARAMEGRGRVVAIEPYPATAELLRRSLWINGATRTAEVHVVAVGTNPGQSTLYVGTTSGHHSLYPLGDSVPNSADTVEVRVSRLDDLISPGQSVDVLKIDVEGAELDVMRSAQRILEENPDAAIIVEFGPSHLTRTGVSTADWFGTFERHGMNFRVIDAQSGTLVESTVEELQQVSSANLLFARPSAPVWSKALP